MFEGHKYVLSFPDEWILNEIAGTGRECANCCGAVNKEGVYEPGFAMWRGLIIGYCVNCSYFEYYQDRGYGFIGQAIETSLDYFTGISAFGTYLKDVDLDNLGDLSENSEDTIENHDKKKIETLAFIENNNKKESEDCEREMYEEMEEYYNKLYEYDSF